ncbi:MAG: F0F1 ATP synthase subunit epsilon [Bacteroidales bacterium]|nr:F0F1 ATP synthase subunit epsilon [Bacteroidales bacterium]
MELVVISPKGTLCREEVESVSLPGTAGRFTVLKDHAPLVSSLVAGDIAYKKDGELHDIHVEGGFVRVSHNRIEVAAEIK